VARDGFKGGQEEMRAFVEKFMLLTGFNKGRVCSYYLKI
jgi:hypothetical protein